MISEIIGYGTYDLRDMILKSSGVEIFIYFKFICLCTQILYQVTTRELFFQMKTSNENTTHLLFFECGTRKQLHTFRCQNDGTLFGGDSIGKVGGWPPFLMLKFRGRPVALFIS